MELLNSEKCRKLTRDNKVKVSFPVFQEGEKNQQTAKNNKVNSHLSKLLLPEDRISAN